VKRACEVATTLPNKGMTQTKPAQAMELRSLSAVFDGRTEAVAGRVVGYRGRGGVVRSLR
jgi:hypothetical protein